VASIDSPDGTIVALMSIYDERKEDLERFEFMMAASP
jgi:hypothetical protein